MVRPSLGEFSKMGKGIEIRDAHFPGRAPIDAYGNGGFRFADMSHRGTGNMNTLHPDVSSLPHLPDSITTSHTKPHHTCPEMVLTL